MSRLGAAREFTAARPATSVNPPIGLAGRELANFAASLRPDSPLYWPAMAASDGCDASLDELNQMLREADCLTFPARAVAKEL